MGAREGPALELADHWTLGLGEVGACPFQYFDDKRVLYRVIVWIGRLAYNVNSIHAVIALDYERSRCADEL